MNALQGAFSSMGGSGASGSQNNEVAGSGDSGTSSGGSSGLRPSGTGDMSTSKFPIVGVFKKYFDGCLEKTGIGPCKFVNLGILGDAAHRARRSCHNSGEAIDIGPLTCAGGKSISTTDPRFYNVARCMAHNTDNKLEIIYYKADGSNMIQKSDHSNHMHIQLKHCLMVTGQYKIGQ